MNLKDLCRERALTQKALSEKTGIAQSSLSMYMNGQRKPTYETAKRLADALGVSVEELYGDQTEKKDTFAFQEKILLSCFRQLSEDGQDELIQTALKIMRKEK